MVEILQEIKCQMSQIVQVTQDIKERMVRVETRLDRLGPIEEKAFEAHNKVSNLESEIAEIKERNKWGVRTTITSSIAAITAIVVAAIALIK